MPHHSTQSAKELSEAPPVPRARRSIAASILLALATGASPADDRPLPPAAAQSIDFNRDVAPIFAARCNDCHGASKQRGGLRLDTPAAIRQGGGSGEVVLPGRSAESPLIHHVAGVEGAARMPPKGEPLGADAVAILRAWVDQAPEHAPASPIETAPNEPGWALEPLHRPAVPSPINSIGRTRNPVDAFILDMLDANHLRPSPEADRRTLIRRVSLDLTGLPPTPEELDRFLADEAPDAYERLVDRLLSSPRHGERWARHWLDVAHYADSHGQDEDRPRPNAWPYRDYLIRSFNADKPYPRFVREQVAGDVLFADDPEAIRATGFLAAGPWDESGLMGISEDSIDRQIARYLDRDDIVTSTMSTFAGLTVHCARCHDHKFDPITQDDYYALQAVFAGVDKAERAFDADPAVARLRAALERSLAQLRPQGDNPDSPDNPAEVASRFEAQLAALPPLQHVYCGTNRFTADGSFRPAATPRAVHVLKRGEIGQPERLAEPGSVLAVPGVPGRFVLDDPDDEGRRRAALAHWLTDPANPLPWRAMANRVWHHHFGRGIVDTPNDFGKMGGAPSHPALLDWLAVELREQGSIKHLHRLIVTSATYRQSSRHDPAAAAIDADNRLSWRMNRSRLDAESVRDAIVLASGRLDDAMFGPPVLHFVMSPGVHVTPVADYEHFDVDQPGARRRSVYRYVFRTRPDPLLESLDCPDASQSAPARTTSVSALQALALWNNKFTLRHAEHLAQLAGESTPDPDDQVQFVALRVLGRPPTITEQVEWANHAARHGLANLARVLFNSSEFLFAD